MREGVREGGVEGGEGSREVREWARDETEESDGHLMILN